MSNITMRFDCAHCGATSLATQTIDIAMLDSCQSDAARTLMILQETNFSMAAVMRRVQHLPGCPHGTTSAAIPATPVATPARPETEFEAIARRMKEIGCR